MDPDRRRYLAIYLNDHLAAMTATVERARRTRYSEEPGEFAEPLAALCRGLEEDRSALESVMDEIGLRRSRARPAFARFGETVGALKPNGHLRDRSPLGRVVDLEVLILGICAKSRLWTLLTEVLDGGCGADLEALISRAEHQRAIAEDLQRRAALLL